MEIGDASVATRVESRAASKALTYTPDSTRRRRAVEGPSDAERSLSLSTSLFSLGAEGGGELFGKDAREGLGVVGRGDDARSGVFSSAEVLGGSIRTEG